MKRVFAVIAAFLIFLTGCSEKRTVVNNGAKQMEITFFKIGNADSILLEIGDSTMLIDTGEKGDGGEILTALIEKNIRKLDYMIITHFDKDHVGGAAAIVEGMEIGKILQPNYVRDNDECAAYNAALAERGIAPERLTESVAFELDGAKFTVIPSAVSNYPDDNNYSLITELLFGERSFLFAGDAESERISEYLKASQRKFDFLKVPHHGRTNDMTAAFFKSVSPQYAVVCCGKNEEKTNIAKKLLESIGTSVYFTRDGTVTLTCDGSNITVSQSGY